MNAKTSQAPVGATTLAPDPAPTGAPASMPPAMKDLVYQFKISRLSSPIEFRNLWELAFKGPQDSAWRVEIDADMLSTVIGRMNHIFEQDGL